MLFSTLISLLSLISLTIAIPSLPSSSSIDKRGSDVAKFTIDLTWADYDATGGVVRKAILTNGTIPGPALKVKVGQDVEFMVHNNLPFGTSVHFHGVAQLNTPWSDGVTGLTQRPIPAGASYLYKWKAEEAGTYFYHAHHKGQMMDGLYGAIIIEADEKTERPFSLISADKKDIEAMMKAEKKNEPVFISDWTQFTFDEFYKIQQAANIDNACADAILVNGKGAVFCQSRADIDAFTAPQLKPLLAAVKPPQLTNKGCLPPNLPATQGNFTFNLAALPDAAYFSCKPTGGKTSEITVSKAEGWAALTFINSGGFASLKFTIDSHKMWVYAVSGEYVKPQYVDQVVVNNGDRYSVLIKLDQPVATYKINVANNGLNQIISGFGAIAYEGSTGPDAKPKSVMNYAGINTTAITKFNDVLATPFKPVPAPPAADLTLSFNIKKLGRPFGSYEWTLSGKNGYNMSNDDAEPLLFKDPNTIPASDLILKTGFNQWVDLIVKVQGPLAQSHPMHKHANKAFVLGQGKGPFNYATVAEAAAAMPPGTFNLVNPPYRDTYTTTPAEGNSSWMALRYKADHPGVWAFHCHMQTHFSGGMAVVLMDAPDKIPVIPKEYQDGNGCPKDSPYYSALTGPDMPNDGPGGLSTSNGSNSSGGSGGSSSGSPDSSSSTSAPSPSSPVKPFKGTASVSSASLSFVFSVFVAALVGFSM